MATVRRELRMHHPAEAVWSAIGDAAAIQEWFPGIVAATVDGSTRTITLGSGIPMVEEIVTNDPILRRFQYRLTGGFIRSHLGTVDVIDLDDGTCLAVYSTDAEPDVMALVVGGATGNALHELRRQFDSGERGDTADRPASTDGSAR
jgi:hypothetical protein